MGTVVRTDILTPEEAARYLRVHSQTVYRRLRAGKLPGAKVGDQWRIRKADLDQHLKGGPAQEALYDEEPLSAADLKEIRQGLEDIRLGRVISREAHRRKRSA
jgi:excisionase family DNA binding protein